MGQACILVLGYGEMGHAMEYLLRERHRLAIWEKFPQAGFNSADLVQAASEAELLLFCLPAKAHHEVALQVAPLLQAGALCVSVAKGLDADGRNAAQVFSEALSPGQPYALVYGPMISEEIRAARHAFAQVGCSRSEDFARIQQVFQDTRLHLQPCADIPGISWSVILKNVYAPLFGISDELQLGDNLRGYLAIACLEELSDIVVSMGGQPHTSYQLAGLGDLITTATSPDSHHYSLGRKLARGDHAQISGEGVHTLQMVREHRLFDITDYPLFSLMDSIVQTPQQTVPLLEAWLARL